MSATPKWATLRQTVLDDARLGNGYAHLEAGEVPAWVDESNDDLTHALAEALCDVEDKPRLHLNALLDALCQDGEDLSQRKSAALLDTLREALRTYCTAQAQRFVDREGA